MKKHTGHVNGDRSVTDVFISREDRIFYAVNSAFIGFILLLVLVPITNIVASSFSSAKSVMLGKVFLWPVEWSVEGYIAVFNYQSIWLSYFNTILYTLCGSGLCIVMTILAAYPLSSHRLPFRNAIMFLFTFTMFFNGGLIPTYITVKTLGLLNSRLSLILPSALSIYNMIVARTFMQSIPGDLREAADLDGCSDIQYLVKVVLPLSKTLISVLTIFYAVGFWNDYFSAFLYLTDRSKQPLQTILREVLIANTMNIDSTDEETMLKLMGMADLLKHSLIIVSTLPILILYPFMQKYFVKGVMIGSLKG